MRVINVEKNNGIAHIVMEDRRSKNTFSEEFTDGLLMAFADIDRDPELKVVILSGYDNYFCCGGTQEELLKIFNGDSVFTKGQIYDLLLRCKLPVISAMQGHALGGGLVMGSYADFIVMGKQCIYSTNFMKYGFTPGFGATYIIPQKFGGLLGSEMLITAGTYQGSVLQQRGAPVIIVDKNDVLGEAYRIANSLLDKPRVSLLLLKERLAEIHRREVQVAVEKELQMHKISFKQPEVRENIHALF